VWERVSMKDNNHRNTDHPPFQALETYAKEMKPNGILVFDRNHSAIKERFQAL